MGTCIGKLPCGLDSNCLTKLHEHLWPSAQMPCVCKREDAGVCAHKLSRRMSWVLGLGGGSQQFLSPYATRLNKARDPFRTPRKVEQGRRLQEPQSWDEKPRHLQPVPSVLERMRRALVPCFQARWPDRRCIPIRGGGGKVCALAASYRPLPTLSVVVGVPHAPRGQESRALVPVGNPVGMRLGSHVSRGRGGGCGFQGRDRSGLARGPCSALGPPRTASSRAPPLGPAEALSARQGPGRELPERVPVLRGAEQEAAGVRGTAGARRLERARGGRGSLHRRHRVSRPGLRSEWQPPPRPWSRPSGDPTPARGCRSRSAHPPSSGKDAVIQPSSSL